MKRVRDQELTNPCLKEMQLTYRCFNKNDYDKDKCELHITNYKNCKTFWNTVQQDRRRHGLYPLLPTPEDREAIKTEYMASKKH